MSVLLEGYSLVIDKADLEDRFPGGREAFLEATRRLSPPPRYVCEDEHLLALSFYGYEHLEPFVDVLHAAARADEDASVVMAWVDQELGPDDDVTWWLACAHHEDGYSYLWNTQADPGALVADEKWTPERSRALVRRDLATETTRLLPLTEDGPIATWLDLERGKEVIGWAKPTIVADGPDEIVCSFLGDAALEPIVCQGTPEAQPTSPDETHVAGDRAEQVRARIVEILQAEDLRYHPWDQVWLEVPFTADAVRVVVRLAPAQSGNFVRLYATSDMRVPEGHRGAACELLTRANWGLPIGGFEMDLRDGEVVFKGTIFLGEDGELRREQLAGSIRGAVHLFDQYYPALMRMIYGGASPADAIAEVEK